MGALKSDSRGSDRARISIVAKGSSQRATEVPEAAEVPQAQASRGQMSHDMRLIAGGSCDCQTGGAVVVVAAEHLGIIGCGGAASTRHPSGLIVEPQSSPC